jgi:hypothetical protein
MSEDVAFNGISATPPAVLVSCVNKGELSVLGAPPAPLRIFTDKVVTLNLTLTSRTPFLTGLDNSEAGFIPVSLPPGFALTLASVSGETTAQLSFRGSQVGLSYAPFAATDAGEGERTVTLTINISSSPAGAGEGTVAIGPVVSEVCNLY